MSYELATGFFFAGVATGMFISGKADLGTKIINEIAKVKTKGDNSPIDVIQDLPKEPTKKPFLKRIFKRKKNEQ